MPSLPLPLSRGKRAAFRAAAIALPVLALLLLEGGLRLAGVGTARRAPFQPVPSHETSVALDPDYGRMFFRGFQPGVAFDPFQREKGRQTVRLMVLGGSTTAGFPYSWYYGFPGRLEDQLAEMLPGRRVEVANLGMTATNSFTLWALSEPVIEQRPDAVLIYSGHNEYYGAYGPASTQGWPSTSVWARRAVIRASRWAVVTGVSGLLEPEAVRERRTMMARVVRDASVEAGGAAYAAGIAQYEANLRDALGRFERARIPVFLATLTSNLAGQAPLGDEPEALAAYDRGRQRLAAGDSAGARQAFLSAKEADGLRFRAPEALNDIVRRLAGEFSNVTLVDVQQRFRDASPGGVEGDSLFTDHLHPNARGYALMADAFADALRQRLAVLREAPPPSRAPDAIDDLERGMAHLQLAVLTNGYPFRKDRTPDQAEAMARAEADSMARSGRPADALAVRVVTDGLPVATALHTLVRAARAQPDTLAALRAYAGLLHWQPFNDPLMATALGYALHDAAYDPETAVLARYASIHSAAPLAVNVLAAVALRQGDLARADALLTAAERSTPDAPEVLFNRARLLVLQGDTARARTYFARYQATQGPPRAR